MQIILKGGPLHEQTGFVGDAVRQFSEDGSVYKITDETSDDGSAIFRYDEKGCEASMPPRIAHDWHK